MKVVVLAAGVAYRMKGIYPDKPKGLYRVAGRELVYRTMRYLQELGFNEFVVVTNGLYKEQYEDFMKRNGFEYEIVVNDHHEKGNGYSLYLAKEHVGEKFILIMTDHVYERAFVERAVGAEGLVVDREGRFIDHQEATKVKLNGNRVVAIGKNLERFDAFDTGFFVLNSREIFGVAEELVRDRDVIELSDIIGKAGVETTEISGLFWADADTPEELRKLKRLIIKNAVKGSGDGWVSRNFNRKISTWLSSYLCDYITPNEATLISFVVGVVSAVVAYFSAAAGGVLYQISSILDGIDGEIARASMRESRFGGWLDSVLDRVVDVAFIVSLAHFLPLSYGYMVLLGVTVFGVIMVSYTTERFKGAYGMDAHSVIEKLRYIPGKRDERIALAMVFCLIGFVKTLFFVLAVMANLRVLLTVYLVYQWNRRRGERS